MTGPVDPPRASSVTTLWRLVEAYHSLVYFAPERPEVYSGLGLKGGWMGYFASRSAALGAVPAEVVTACFFGFAPRMVERALPDAWRRTTPEEAVAARLIVVDRAVRRHLGGGAVAPVVARAADRLTLVVEALPPAGAPLFAAHRSLPRPDAAHLALFWATTALREYRGDAHIAALRSAGLGPVDSNVLMAALELVPEDHRTYRGWTEEEWDAGAAALADRGWLDHAGVTPRGRRERQAVEARTDAMTAQVWAGLDDDELASLVGDLRGVVDPIVSGGGFPYPNGVGVPRPDAS